MRTIHKFWSSALSPKYVNLPFASGSAAARRPRVRELNPLGGKLSTDPLTSLNTVHHGFKTDDRSESVVCRAGN